MNEVLKLIKKRRAVRAYLPQPVEEEKLNAIIEAGLYAPNAGSRQVAMIAVCENPKIIDCLEKLNAQALRETMRNRPAGHAVQMPAVKGEPSVFYGAPVVATIFAPKDWYNFTLDCAATAENMLLAATSLGLGSNIIARATETFASEYGQALQAEWGIPENYEAKLHVILGYAAAEPEAAHPRKEGRVVIVK